MPKQKMTTGVLARDKDKVGEIVFCAGGRRKDVRLTSSGFWAWKTDFSKPYTEFSPDEWEKNYDLKPPRKGTAFEVEIEL